MLDGRLLPMRHGVARATGYATLPPPMGLPVVRGAGEQSNSCVGFGDRYLLKVIRRLEAGPHPEVELLRVLARRRFGSVPRLAATLEYQCAGEEPATLALIQTFVANQGTAWDRAVADARTFIGREAAVAAGEAIEFLDAASSLGRTTAALHIALGEDGDDPAFTPEPFTRTDADRLADEMRVRAARVLALLEDRFALLPASALQSARALLDARQALERQFEAGRTAPAGAMRTRVHGDYHLGQVLATGRRFVIIDFEGEPTKSLAERRAKQSPLKDVAGMLRSFGYAAHTARRAAGAADVHESRRQAWEAAVGEAFVSGYRAAMAGAGLVPAGARAFARLLAAFVLDKAIYEVEYELASRPEWVTIPLRGLLQNLGPTARA